MSKFTKSARTVVWYFVIIASMVLCGCDNSDSNQSNNSQTQPQSITVHITRTGKKYHRAGCRYLSHSDIPIDLEKAKAEGYTPCKVCNPPR
jgi:hypothetical protein